MPLSAVSSTGAIKRGFFRAKVDNTRNVLRGILMGQGTIVASLVLDSPSLEVILTGMFSSFLLFAKRESKKKKKKKKIL